MKKEIFISKASGTVTVPPSKSVCHRAILCAMLSKKPCKIQNVAPSDDISATVDVCRAFGGEFTLDGTTLYVKSGKKDTKNEYYCNESGSTLRFIIPIFLTSGEKCTFLGSKRLMERGISVYQECLKEITFTPCENGFTATGKLRGGRYEMAGDVSSQFISGMLMALPLLADDSEIVLSKKLESSSYVDLTIDVLQKFGIAVQKTENGYRIRGGQTYLPCDYTVEGDCSNGAFLEFFAQIGCNVTVCGLPKRTKQPDFVFPELCKRLKDGFCEIDLSNIPDLGPILFVCACVFHGAKFIGTRRLKIKESDRVLSMQEELFKFGITLQIGENEVTIAKQTIHAPSECLNGHNDHRIVMALAVLSTLYGGKIDGWECVEKSFPTFFTVLSQLGIEEKDVR